MYSFLLCVMQQPTDSCFFLSCRMLILFLQQLELLVVKREMSQIENEKGLELGVIRYQVSSTGIKERVELKYALVHISLRISFFFNETTIILHLASGLCVCTQRYPYSIHAVKMLHHSSLLETTLPREHIPTLIIVLPNP